MSGQRRGAARRRPDAFIVGWVGRMTAVKRTDDVVRALRGLVDRGVDAYLCLVGDGPDRDHLEQLRSRARRREALPVRRLPGGCRTLLQRDRRVAPAVGERGHAGERDRGPRRAAARGGNPRRRHARRDPRRCRRIPRRGRRRRSAQRAPGRARRRSRATRSDGRRGPRARARSATPSNGSSTTSTGSTDHCSMRAPADGARIEQHDRSISRAGARGTSLQEGFFLPATVSSPDCQPPMFGSSRHEEPEHHVDPRVLARDRVRLLHVQRLLRPADSEDRLVGRVRLVAVLRDPEVLRPVELRDQRDQQVHVPDLDPPRVCARRLVARRLGARCRRTDDARRRRSSSSRTSSPR